MKKSLKRLLTAGIVAGFLLVPSCSGKSVEPKPSQPKSDFALLEMSPGWGVPVVWEDYFKSIDQRDNRGRSSWGLFALQEYYRIKNVPVYLAVQRNWPEFMRMGPFCHRGDTYYALVPERISDSLVNADNWKRSDGFAVMDTSIGDSLSIPVYWPRH